jgi:serine/threonine protein kinase
VSKTVSTDAEKTILISSAAPVEPLSSMGRFEIIRPLGQGGMGEVFLAIDREHPERGTLALKTIFPALMQDPEIVARFESEAKLLASIKHPNVVRLVEWGTFENGGKPTHFMAMEFIDGISLHTLARRRRLSLADVLDIAIQIARGLNETHVANVVHRDLKPANIMITREGLAKIIDFGIAKPSEMGLESDEDPERGFKTKTGMVIGTVNYIAPEILRGLPASPSSDIYALGLIIWEMVNGLTPFKSKDLAETMHKVTNELLEWSDAIFDIAPPGFTKLVARMTAKLPEKRLPDAKTTFEELEKLRSNANWSGRFGRKTRFDLDINWDQKTIDEIRTHGIKESEVGFVLQEIEERMIEQRDSRLDGTGPITVEAALIKRSIDSYKSMRHRAAMTKATRVREQLGSALPPSSGNTKLSPTISMPKPAAQKPDRTGMYRALRKVASTFLSLAIVAGLGFYAFERARSRIRAVASENEATLESVNSLITARANPAAPVATRGSELSYSMKLKTPTGNEVVSQQTRKLAIVATQDITWLVDGRTAVHTPRNVIPLQTFFSPIYRSISAPANAKSIEGIESFKPGATFSVKISDEASDSKEETNCTVVDSRRQTLVTRIHETWKIECLRKVSKTGRLTHRIVEIYEYIPAVSSLYSVFITAEEIGPSGMIASSTTTQMQLQIELSKLEQSDPKELSPW